jgi:3-methylfumaryl-CoA hydratase
VPLHVCGQATEGGAEVWTQQGEGRNMVATVRKAVLAGNPQ